MDSNISIAVTTVPKWGLGECIEAWARLGIPAMGITRHKAEEYGLKKAASHLRDAGIKVSCMHGVGGPYSPGETLQFEQDLARARSRIEMAAELGAECGLVVTGPRAGRSWDDCVRGFAGGLREVLPFARERRLRLAIEPLHPIRHPWTFLNTIRDASAIAEELDDPYAGYVFDSWAHWWEPRIEDLLRDSIERVFMVHVGDQRFLTTRLPDRAMLGEGVVPITALLRVLKSSGYTGRYEIETITEDIEDMGYAPALKQLLSAYDRLKP